MTRLRLRLAASASVPRARTARALPAKVRADPRRDKFAAEALEGLLASGELERVRAHIVQHSTRGAVNTEELNFATYTEVAATAWALADSMLIHEEMEREERTGELS